MTAVPKPRKLTVAEYLAAEATSEVRHEFFNGETFAMAGASREHNVLTPNLHVLVGMRLLGGPCRTFDSDQRLLVPRTGLYTYPDLMIVCGEPVYSEDDRNTLVNPRVVFEVLSPSTEGYDRGMKFLHIQRLPSVQEYVLVSQDQPLVEVFARQPDGRWLLSVCANPAGEFELTSVPIRVSLADLYRGVEFGELPLR